MKTTRKGPFALGAVAVICATAAALAASGAGSTLALWSDSLPLPAHTLRTGVLTLEQTDGISWYRSGLAIDPAVVAGGALEVSPGDVLVARTSVAATLAGTNLVADLTAAVGELLSGEWVQDAAVEVTLHDGPRLDGLTAPRSVPVTVTITLPAHGPAGGAEVTFSLRELTVLLHQQRTGGVHWYDTVTIALDAAVTVPAPPVLIPPPPEPPVCLPSNPGAASVLAVNLHPNLASGVVSELTLRMPDTWISAAHGNPPAGYFQHGGVQVDGRALAVHVEDGFFVSRVFLATPDADLGDLDESQVIRVPVGGSVTLEVNIVRASGGGGGVWVPPVWLEWGLTGHRGPGFTFVDHRIIQGIAHPNVQGVCNAYSEALVTAGPPQAGGRG